MDFDDTKYKIELIFNNKGELTEINYPTNMNIALAANHIAVANSYLIHQIVEQKLIKE